MWFLLSTAVYLLPGCVSTSPENVGSKTLDQQPLDPPLDLLAERFLKEINDRLAKECTQKVFAVWSYVTNITDETQQRLTEAILKEAMWNKQAWKLIQTWKDHESLLTEKTLKRQFDLFNVLGTDALPDKELKEFNNIVAKMTTLYSTAKICDYNDRENCQLSLTPEISEIMQSSRNYSELVHVWTAWRNSTGKKIRDLYKDYVRLSNKAAKLNGLDNMGDMWLQSYSKDTNAFRQDMKEIYEQLKPLFEQLHAYARRRLREVYGSEVVTEKGPIPANILGDMWAQLWDNINELMVPYPNKTSLDVTEAMQKQGYTPLKMFEIADDFFASLNLTRMPEEFWNHTIMEKPKDTDISCHPYAYDFCNGKDFRVKMCTDVNMHDLLVVHHEMGHIQYYLQYKDLPIVFRNGANGGFHEAIGEVISLSVATPKHLHKIGLLEKLEDDKESEINFLMKMALNKVAYVPYGYLLELWRWNVFAGTTEEKDWNCAWWDLRYELQGVKPPVVRTEDDFDPAAKFHTAADVPYIRYFVANVLQFQFLKAMCVAAGEYDPQDPRKPLHRCDFYQSTAAGKVLGDVLKLGASKPWPKAMAVITGQRKIDASVLREYFKPLEDWLIEDNKKHQQFIGWIPDGEYCVRSKA